MASNAAGNANGTRNGLNPIRIVVGSDNAGHAYKDALKKELEKHAGVASVLDVGVHDSSDSTAYPHPAVDACKKIKAGEVGTPSQCCWPIILRSCSVLRDCNVALGLSADLLIG